MYEAYGLLHIGTWYHIWRTWLIQVIELTGSLDVSSRIFFPQLETLLRPNELNFGLTFELWITVACPEVLLRSPLILIGCLSDTLLKHAAGKNLPPESKVLIWETSRKEKHLKLLQTETQGHLTVRIKVRSIRFLMTA